jgi:prepilin-type N-terminal cleavage/methylation domain-containing protein
MSYILDIITSVSANPYFRSVLYDDAKRTKKHAGFTLIELLVVIAVIAVLMAILMPSLRAAKQQAAASNCLANARTLAMAWFMYAGDWNDKLVPARMIDNGDKGWIGTPRTEAGVLVSISQTNPEVTDEDEIRGIKKGQLFKYVEDAGVYHCPADNIRMSVHDKSRLFATYQIPSCLNGETTANVPQIKTLSNVKEPLHEVQLRGIRRGPQLQHAWTISHGGSGGHRQQPVDMVESDGGEPQQGEHPGILRRTRGEAQVVEYVYDRAC